MYKTLSLLLSTLLIAVILSLSNQAMASAFQIWEQDGASIGHYHAGYAAEAADASTAFYNPAGITRIKNHQLVAGGAAVFPSIRYKGTVAVNTINNNEVRNASVDGGIFAFVPNIHYVAPISDRVGLGLSIGVPFGSKINYGRSSFLRYASTYNSIMVVDVSPSIGVKVNDQTSLGAGLDVQRMHAEFNAVGANSLPDSPDYANTDTSSVNKLKSTGYGYHLGILQELTPTTRVGLSYHSKVVHHLSGRSTFTGPLADPNFDLNPLATTSSRATSTVTLPPYTALSLYHHVHPKVALMTSAIYTQWNSIQHIILNGVSGLQGAMPSSNLKIDVPQYFRNTWNLSFGADYFLNEVIILRGGVGYDETPISNAYRNVQLPDNNRYVASVGAHYQATKNIGLDLSWMHIFMPSSSLNPPPLVIGDQVVITNADPDQVHGHVRGGADVFGLQLTWNIV